MPRNGLGFWVWLAAALATIVGTGFLFWRHLRIAKTELEKSDAFLMRPKFRLPLGLAGILLVGLAANLLVVFANPQPLRFDAWGYSDQGFNISRQGYKADAIRTPGYPFFVTVVYKLVGDAQPLRDPVYGLSDPPNRNMIALWLVQALLLSLTVVIVYALTSELFSKRENITANDKWRDWGQPLPLLAAGLVAFCPFLWGYTGTPQTEICATFWLTATVYFWVKALRSHQIALYYVLTGLGLAWTLESRPTFVFLPLVVLTIFLIFGKGRWRLFGPVLIAVPLLLMLIPPFAANLRDWDEPTPLIAGDLSTYQTVIGVINVTWGAMPYQQKVLTPADARFSKEDRERLREYVPSQQAPDKASRHAESDYWKRYFSGYVTGNLLEYGGTMLRRAWFQWSQHFVFPYYDPAYWDYRLLTDNLNRLYLIFGLVGLGITIAKRPYRWTMLPLYLTILYLMGLNLLVRVEFRYTLPVYPLLLIFAALGLWEVGKAIGWGVKRARQRGMVAGVKSRAQPPPTGVLVGFGLAFLLIGGLSVAWPLIPATSAAREKALDAVYASQQQADPSSCYYSSAREALNRAIARGGSEREVKDWEQQFPKEVENAINIFSRRIEANPKSENYESYRCRGDAYRVQGKVKEARADFLYYLTSAPADARERKKVEGWLRELT